MVNTWKDKKKKAQFVLFEYKHNIKSQGVFFTFDVRSHGLSSVPLRVDGDEDGRQVGKGLYFI